MDIDGLDEFDIWMMLMMDGDGFLGEDDDDDDTFGRDGG